MRCALFRPIPVSYTHLDVYKRQGQKGCTGFRQVDTLRQDIDIDENLEFSIPIGLQLSLIVLPAYSHAGNRISDRRNHIVRGNPLFSEQCIQCDRMVYISGGNLSLILFHCFSLISCLFMLSFYYIVVFHPMDRF